MIPAQKEIDKLVYLEVNFPKSVYEFIISTYISRPIASILKKLGFQNTKSVTVASFIFLIAVSFYLVFFQNERIISRVIIAVLIEVSLILVTLNGQLVNATRKNTLFSGWLNHYLPRIGEMVLYTSIGYITWRAYGGLIYFIMGLGSGYLFTYCTILYSLKDSVQYEDVKKKMNSGIYNRPCDEKNSLKVDQGARGVTKRIFFKKNHFFDILSIIFFFLNIGLGERYLYPIFFLILNRTDIMLPIIFPLILIKAVKETIVLSQNIVYIIQLHVF